MYNTRGIATQGQGLGLRACTQELLMAQERVTKSVLGVLAQGTKQAYLTQLVEASETLIRSYVLGRVSDPYVEALWHSHQWRQWALPQVLEFLVRHFESPEDVTLSCEERHLLSQYLRNMCQVVVSELTYRLLPHDDPEMWRPGHDHTLAQVLEEVQFCELMSAMPSIDQAELIAHAVKEVHARMTDAEHQVRP